MAWINHQQDTIGCISWRICHHITSTVNCISILPFRSSSFHPGFHYPLNSLYHLPSDDENSSPISPSVTLTQLHYLSWDNSPSRFLSLSLLQRLVFYLAGEEGLVSTISLHCYNKTKDITVTGKAHGSSVSATDLGSLSGNLTHDTVPVAPGPYPLPCLHTGSCCLAPSHIHSGFCSRATSSGVLSVSRSYSVPSCGTHWSLTLCWRDTCWPPYRQQMWTLEISSQQEMCALHGQAICAVRHTHSKEPQGKSSF